MPVFNVEIEGVIVVVAESENDATNKAQDALRSYGGRFSEDLSAIIAHQVKSAKDLYDQWDGDCIPYGADDNKPISDYIT